MNDNKLESVLQQLSPAYQDSDSALILGDNRAIMAALPPNSIDMVFADPPYFLSNGGKQMKDIWSGPVTPRSEKIFGKHPTQKPIYLLDTIVRATSLPNDIVLDPFCGSSTTGVACKRLGRNFIGIDQEAEYIELSANRLAHENMNFAIDDGA